MPSCRSNEDAGFPVNSWSYLSLALLCRISLTAMWARAISNFGGHVRNDYDGLLEDVREQEELAPFLGGIDGEQLSLQLELLEETASR